MEKTKKRGGIGLLITSIIALIMLVCSSFVTYRGVGAVLLYAPENGIPVFFSLFRFMLGFLFVAGIFLIGKKSEKKGIIIPFSIVNMLIAFAAFMPVRRYRIMPRHAVNIFASGYIGAGLVAALPFVFYALIILFALLTMISAVKKDRKQPKGLCLLILITLGVYALISVVTLMFESPFMGWRLRFRGVSYIEMYFRQIVRGRINIVTLLNPFGSTAHALFPFATIPVLLAMFFAAKSIKPVEAAAQAEAAPVYAQACSDEANYAQPYSDAADYAQPYAAPAYEQPQARYSGKSKVAAAILAGAIGNFGVHRFYLGRAGSAVVQLLGGISMIIGYVVTIIETYAYRPNISVLVFALVLLMFGCGTGIWAFVDFIRILCNKLKPAAGEFGNAPQARAAQPEYFAPQPVYTAPAEPVSPAAANEAAAQYDHLGKLDDMLNNGQISMEEYIDIRRRLNRQ